jgi:repressor LexA
VPNKQLSYNKHVFCVIMDGMNPIQQKLLDIAKLQDIGKMRRVDLVNAVGCDYPSQITHHMAQLIKKGYLVRNAGGKIVASPSKAGGAIRLPIMGEADCGEATKFADGTIQDYLLVSDSVLSIPRNKASYALIARGDSMNRASVNGKAIESGDYAIVQIKDGYIPSNGDYVVSIINGMANIKRYNADKKHRRIVLEPESLSDNYAPIIIAESDAEYYKITGRS